MTEIEKIIHKTSIGIPLHVVSDMVEELNQYVIKARIEELEYCLESFEDDMGKYDISRLWIENERIAQLKKEIK